jgi:hypothetical protein
VTTVANALSEAIKPFEQLFVQKRSWDKAQELMVGALLCRGQRTMSRVLRVLGSIPGWTVSINTQGDIIGNKAEEKVENRRSEEGASVMKALSAEVKAKLEEHLIAVSQILYEHAESGDLESFESIEKEVRVQLLETVAPRIGEFFCQKGGDELEVNNEQSKVV